MNPSPVSAPALPSAASAQAGRVAGHKPGLARLAAVTAAWAFVTVALGAFTTSINAGMIFPDWPLSNGSLNPAGWLSNLAMFAEHSHRLSVGVLSALTIATAVWLWRRESRSWLRKLGLFSVGLVLVQAIVGGLRVLLNDQTVAMLHACLAQAFVCTLIAIAAACTRAWIARPIPVAGGLRAWGSACCAILFAQLAVAAIMRHTFAGLAIPTFPYSTPQGGLLPAAWDFRVAIHFTHRVLAAVLAVALTGFAAGLWFGRGTTLAMRCGASALVSLLALQILLGATIIWSRRDPLVTTAHVLVGALTLATAFWLTWQAHRDRLEGAPA